MKQGVLISAMIVVSLVVMTPGNGVADEYNVVDALGLNTAMDSAKNTIGVADTINLAAGIYSITTTLSIDDHTESSLALIGAGPGQTILDGNGMTQIVKIETLGAGNPGSRILLKDLTFRNGSSASVGAGARVDTTAADLIVDNVRFEENVSVNAGGGLYFKTTNGNVEVMNSYFFSNRTTGSPLASGGGIYAGTSPSGDVMIRECSFVNNRSDNAAGGGAGIVTSNGRITVERSFFMDNDALNGWGGGLDVQTVGLLGVVEVNNSLFTGNSADFGGGFSTYADSGSLSVINVTAVSNSATMRAGAMYAVLNSGSASLEVYNNIFYNNTIGGLLGQDIYVISNHDGPVTAKYNNIQELVVTESAALVAGSNIDIDPLLDAQYMLSSGSSCIDAGNSSEMAETVDLTGDPRFVDDPVTADTGSSTGSTPVIDMGAFEYQPHNDNGNGGGGGCNTSTASEDPLLTVLILLMVFGIFVRRKEKV